MIPAEKIIVALDVHEREKLQLLFRHLEGQGVWVKVGMEIFYALGPAVIADAKERGLRVFLDLKIHDIPNTAASALRSLSALPVDMVNVHALGGSEMLKRCAEAVASQPVPPFLIAVTQLTSTAQEQMQLEQGISGSLSESVEGLARLAQAAGLSGVVCSPLEVPAVKAACGAGFLTVTPGIRPKGAHKDDQRRTTTPGDALKLGTDFMVIGRPVTQAYNPREALRAILRGDT